MQELPDAAATLVTIEVSAADHDFARIRRMGAVIGGGVQLALRTIALDNKECVCDRVHGSGERAHHLGQPGDVLVRPATEHRAVIIDRIIVVERADEGEIPAVAGAAISENEFVERLLIEERPGRVAHGFSPAGLRPMPR